MNEEQPVFTGRDIYESFAMELQQWSRTGKAPYQADQDLAWVLENQYARLRSRGLELEYDIVPRGHFVNGHGVRRDWKDGHYITTMDCRSCSFSRTMLRRGKKAFKRQKNTLMYQYITDVYNVYAARQDIHICPNCGAPSTLAGLMDGCDYCGTRFDMPDLYPKVGNYYHIEDAGMTQGEVKGEVGKTMLKTGLIATLVFVAINLFGNQDGVSIVRSVLNSLIPGAAFGVIGGYILWAVGKVAKVFKEAGKAIPLLARMGNSEKRFESQMQMYSPEFSYHYFVDKAVNLLKTVLFSQDPRRLPFYQGQGDETFLDIVDSQFTGATALRDFRVVDGICYVTVDVCLDDLRDTGSRVREKRDWFRMEMYRDVSKPIDLHFSIHNIQCAGCGGSFDAVRHRTCPHCGRPYELQDLDWMVLSVQKQ